MNVAHIPVPHPLDGVHARLDRAKQNIIELDAAIKDFERDNPYVTGTDLNPDDPKKFSYGVSQCAEPPAPLSVIAGEILYLLRSSLDHTVAQLLIRTHSTADVQPLLEHSYFMICPRDPLVDRAKDMATHSSYWGNVPKVSAEARKIIEDCQPCKRPNAVAREDHPLTILDCLNNFDKHRQLLGLGHLMRHLEINPGFQSSGLVLEVRPGVVAGSSNAGKADIVLGTMPNSGPVDVQFNSTFHIAFKDIGGGKAEATIPLLERLLEFVRSLVNDFRTRCPEFRV